MTAHSSADAAVGGSGDGSDGGSPVAIVTGAGSGIGRAIAVGLAGEGYRVALVGRRADRLEETAGLIGGGMAEAFPADVASDERVVRLVADVAARFGRLDAVVNNAGLATLGNAGALGPAAVRELFDVNAIGPINLGCAAIPRLVESGGGVIVTVSSVASVDPFAGLGVYGAAKAAVNLFAKAVATEHGDEGVRSYAVAPGAVETEMLRGLFDESALPRSATLTPESVATVVVDCVVGRRDEPSGSTIVVPSG